MYFAIQLVPVRHIGFHIGETPERGTDINRIPGTGKMWGNL